jgi:Putative metallopeptidase
MKFSKEHDRGPTAASSNRSPSPHVATSVLFSAAILAWSPSGFATAAISPPLRTDQFRTVYEAPKNPAHEALYAQLKAARTLERFRVLLSYIRLPRTLTLKLAGCDGDEDAWYDPDALTVTVCYEYLEAVHKIAPASATPEGVTPENAVLGPLLEVFLHEVAHALFDQLRIPIFGREEDAADQFAAFTLVHLSEHTARDTVVGAAWLYAQEAKGPTLNHADLADVHGLAGQRFYNLLCIAYGAEPRLFTDLVEKQHLPESRAKECADEYGQIAYAVKTLLDRYVDESAREKVYAQNWVGGKLRRKTAGDTPPP